MKSGKTLSTVCIALHLAIVRECLPAPDELPKDSTGYRSYEYSRTCRGIKGSDSNHYVVVVFWRDRRYLHAGGEAQVQTWIDGECVATQLFSTGNRLWIKDIKVNEQSELVFFTVGALVGSERFHTNTVDRAGIHGFLDLTTERRRQVQLSPTSKNVESGARKRDEDAEHHLGADK